MSQRNASLYTESVQELVAIGAAIAANCEPCFKYHFEKAQKLGISNADMLLAVKTANMVKQAPAKAVLELAERFLADSTAEKSSAATVASCCGGTGNNSCCG